MRRILVLASALALLPFTRNIAAQNLVVNSGFDRDIGSWSVWGATQFAQLAWSSNDASGAASSGSISLTNATPGIASASQGVSQCVSLPSTGAYLLGASTRIVPSQSTTGHAFVKIDQYTNVDCTGTYLGTLGGLQFGSTPGLWFPDDRLVTIDASAKSALLVAAVVKDQPNGTYTQQFDDLVLAPSAFTTLTIPASASAHGAAGTFFHTDLWIVNMSRDHTQEVTATLRCQSGTPCPASTKTITLAPRQARLFKDVVAAFFERPEKAGAIELSYDALLGDVCATSRTYTPALPSPTNGTAIPALPSTMASRLALIPGLASSGGSRTAGFRSNAGVYNPTGSAVNVTLSLYDENGARLGTMSRSWGAYEATQVNDVFASLGAGAVVSEGAYLVVEASGSVFSYVTVIDNQSGDSIFGVGAEDAPAN